jgi:peptidoglycan/LPS O-acetylase OafA/YrhL
VALIVAAPLLRAGLWRFFGDHHVAVGVSTLTRMDPLAMGSLLAVVVRSPRGIQALSRWAPSMTVVGFILLGGLIVARHGLPPYDPLSQVVGFSAVGTVAAAVVAAAVTRGDDHLPTRLLSVGPLRSLGKISYAAYVVHLPVLLLLAGRIESATSFLGRASPLVTLAICIGITVGCAWLSWYTFESRFLALRTPLERRFIGDGAGTPR